MSWRKRQIALIVEAIVADDANELQKQVDKLKKRKLKYEQRRTRKPKK